MCILKTHKVCQTTPILFTSFSSHEMLEKLVMNLKMLFHVCALQISLHMCCERLCCDTYIFSKVQCIMFYVCNSFHEEERWLFEWFLTNLWHTTLILYNVEEIINITNGSILSHIHERGGRSQPHLKSHPTNQSEQIAVSKTLLPYYNMYLSRL